MKTNEHRCVLSGVCKLAGTADCTSNCGAFLAMHGHNGDGGRSASANVPADYRLTTLQNSPARADQPRAYQIFDKYAATFTRQFEAGSDRIKSLYLYSQSPGTGKTTSAVALLNHYITTHYVGSLKRGADPKLRPAYMLDVTEWQTDYNAFNRPRVPDQIAEPAAARYYRAMERTKHADFAVLDDVGTRDYTDQFRADLHSIINYRVTNQLPTVYTSNLPIRFKGAKEPGVTYDLVDLFGEERLADRIGDMCATVRFEGESKRGRR